MKTRVQLRVRETIGHPPRLRVLAVLLLWVVSPGCQYPLPAYPSIESLDATFHALGEAQLHAEMRDMAGELRTLLNLHLDDDLSEPARQNDALAALNRIEAIADGIGGDNKITNYSVINDYMGAFLYDVNVAKEFASKNPPNYFPSGTLIKSCLSCHQSI